MAATSDDQLRSLLDEEASNDGSNTLSDPGPLSNQLDTPMSDNNVVETAVYPVRWYILFLFSALAFIQTGLCMIWTSAADSAEAAYGWTDEDEFMLLNWIYITYVVTMPLFAWMVNAKGLRYPCVLSAGLMLAGAVCRCVGNSPPLVTWMAHLGNILNGLAGPVAFAGSTVVSAAWFPPHQRTTATCIGTTASLAGASVFMIIIPYIIEMPVGVIHEGFHRPHSSFNSSLNMEFMNIPQIKKQMMIMRTTECAICAAIFFAILVYFPSTPPLPPSLSASENKLNLGTALKQLFRKGSGSFWLAALVAGASQGIYGVWVSTLVVQLQPLHVEQVEAGWLGFLPGISGVIISVLIARVADKFMKHLKLILLVLMTISCLLMLGLVYIFGLYVQNSTVLLYMCDIGIGVTINSAMPLFYEMVIEAIYPADEILTSSVISWLYNLFPLVFLFSTLIPGLGKVWMNWCLFGTVIVCTLLLFGFKEDYRRLKVDEEKPDRSLPVNA